MPASYRSRTLLTHLSLSIFSSASTDVATSKEPFGDPQTIEIAVTTLLIVVNALVIVILFAFFGVELIGLRRTCYEKERDVFAVASSEQTRTALAGTGVSTDGQRWCHPNGVAIAAAPTSATDTIWTWVDAEGTASASMDPPTLLLPVESFAMLPSGATFHWVHKKNGHFSAMQTKPRDVGGWVCGGGATRDGDRDVVEGDIEMAVQHDNVHARHHDAAGGGAAARALVADEPDTVAELQAALQESETALQEKDAALLEKDAALLEKDAALLEKDAENAQLKEENEALRMQSSGAVVDLVVAADAPDASATADAAAEVSIAAGVGPDAKRWCYSDYDNVVHGPFALTEFYAWYGNEHFELDQPLHLDKGGPIIALKEALREMAWWYYAELDGSGSMCGPFSLRQLKEWQTGGHFEDGHELRFGNVSGEPTTLIEALRAVEFGLETEEASTRGGGRRRKSVRAESRC